MTRGYGLAPLPLAIVVPPLQGEDNAMPLQCDNDTVPIQNKNKTPYSTFSNERSQYGKINEKGFKKGFGEIQNVKPKIKIKSHNSETQSPKSEA